MLTEKADELKGLAMLTPLLRECKEQIKEEKKRKGDKRPVNAHEVANAAFTKLPQLEHSLEELAELLKKDLKLLSGIKLVLMDGHQNCKKSAN